MSHPPRPTAGDPGAALLTDRSGRSAGNPRGPYSLQQLFPGRSEMARLMRAFDWSKTDLGPPETWPDNLRIAVSLCLTSRIPVVMYWGPRFTVLYNDSYISFLGDAKHPRYLGQPAEACWSEVWDTIGPMLDGVVSTGEATWSEDLPMFFARKLSREEVYVRFTFGPILAADGRTVDGIFCPCMETTRQVVDRRRLDTLRKLGVQPGESWSVESACREAAHVLAGNPQDIAFAAIYLIDRTGRDAKLAARAGLAEDAEGLPASLRLDQPESSPWPFARVAGTRCAETVRLGPIGRFSGGPWPEPAATALVLPLLAAGHERPAGLLVVGASPRRLLDTAYRDFFDLVAGSIAIAIADGRAYEEARGRADALARLDRAKTAFFSNVSHEFRTPLTLILGPIEEILNKPADQVLPANRKLASTVHRSGLRLLKLVNTLLDFSRIEAGRAEAVYEPTDLAAVTADLASVFRSGVEKAGLRLLVDCAPLPEPVYVDRDMWEKIVLNLMSNAVKYTFQGQIAIRLEATADAVELRVEDTGTGIPAGELPRMFERFHRIQGARSRTHEGTGIGLALVQELVKLHGGTIRVESEYGRGSAFIVTLPQGTAHLPKDRIGGARQLQSTAIGAASYVQEVLRWLPDEPASHRAPAHATVAEPASPAWGEPARTYAKPYVLVADDNADMRRYFVRLLQATCEVQAVPDGVAALAEVRERMPDLIVSDIMMPNLDGLGLLKALRRDPAAAAIPVIVLSACAGEDARAQGLAAGADDYLVKPFSVRELLARVGTHLEMARVRRQTEAVLRESEQRFRELADDAPLMIWVTDAQGNVEFVNKTFLTFFGVKPEQVAAQQWRALVHPDDAESHTREFLAASAAGRAFRGECRGRRADGQWRWFEIHAVPRSTASGRKPGMVGCSTDITVRKEAESRVSALRQELQLILDSTPAMIWYKDAHNRILRVNQVAADSIGLPKEAIEGKHSADLYPEEADRYHTDDRLVIESGRPRFGIIEPLLVASGEKRWVQTDKVPLVDGAGTVIGIIVLAVDITERRRAEEEIARLLKQEHAAREEAERANRLKDEFLATVSHELRTPLNAILGWSQLLLAEQLDDATTLRAVRTIEGNARVQIQLTNDLLDVSRIITGKLHLEVKRVALAAVVETVMQTIEPAVKGKRLMLETALDRRPVLVEGDSERLQQVVWNLLSNAVKFTPPGGRIMVTLDYGNDAARLGVSDSGAGIAPDFLPHVFDRLRQFDGSSTREHAGLGLGLSIVRHIVEMHGGTVQAESLGLGQGAKFMVRLPMRQGACGAGASSDRAEAKEERTATVSLKGVRVLFVDDDETALEIVSKILTGAGAEVRTSATAKDAYDIVSRWRPDVILSDLAMPAMDGYSFLRRVRSLAPEDGGQIPAAAVTAYTRMEDRLKALRAGYQNHIPKPVDAHELTMVVAALAHRF